MPWHYRDPAAFPARNPAAMREAVASIGTPIVFGTYFREAEVNQVADTFRWFVWCIRQRPGANSVLGSYLDTYNFRTRKEKMSSGWLLSLTAKQKPLGDLLENNPNLASLLASGD